MDKKPDEPDEELLSFTLELTSHQSAIAAYLRSLLPPGTDPRDLLQEVNITLWKKRSKFEIGTNFKAWAFKVAHFHILNYRRSLKKQGMLIFDNDLLELISDRSSSTITPGLLEEKLEALRVCLRKLRPTDLELLRIRYIDRETIEEFAARNNRNAGSIRGTIRNIRKSLHACIISQLHLEKP